MSNWKELIIGALLAILLTVVTSVLFIYLLTPYSYLPGLELLHQQHKLGKLITICSIPNLGLFFWLMYKKRDFLARGIVLGAILLTLLTLFL
ncbi:hypothetical protein [Flavobacterium sp.]|uniref:hypothetical protein n=1 Tax=Flavobacterium sp. TaxID=239 RepID=UPI002639AC8C|nr:hypothetical protein [Flavobacterium sp.]